jgi:predicted lipid carrier protein YhbT
VFGTLPTTLPPPVALAGLAARALPANILGPVNAVVIGQVARRHPRLFARLRDFADADILIEVSDLGVGLRLWPGLSRPRLEIITRLADCAEPRARVKAPLAVLLGLLDGSIDGDAVFFSRDLAIEGDTELVLALRNAIESEEVDLVEDFLAPLAPFDAPARRAVDLLRSVVRHRAEMKS